MTVVVVLVVPTLTTWLVETSGATPAMSGKAPMASASSRVSVLAVPPPPPFGLMVSKLVPSPARRLVMFAVVP